MEKASTFNHGDSIRLSGRIRSILDRRVEARRAFLTRGWLEPPATSVTLE